jgi:hypothetical protein
MTENLGKPRQPAPHALLNTPSRRANHCTEIDFAAGLQIMSALGLRGVTRSWSQRPFAEQRDKAGRLAERQHRRCIGCDPSFLPSFLAAPFSPPGLFPWLHLAGGCFGRFLNTAIRLDLLVPCARCLDACDAPPSTGGVQAQRIGTRSGKACPRSVWRPGHCGPGTA